MLSVHMAKPLLLADFGNLSITNIRHLYRTIVRCVLEDALELIPPEAYMYHTSRYSINA